jgi:hypothetical protein
LVDVNCAFLAGSIVEGYGNPNSDIDLIVLSGDRPSPGADGSVQTHVFTRLDEAVVEISQVGGETLDVEIHQLSRVEAIVQLLNTMDMDLNSHRHFHQFKLLHQLRVGHAVAGEEALAGLRAAIPWQRLTELLRLRNEALYVAAADDAAGAVKGNDGPAAMLSSRRALGAAIDCLTAAHGHSNPQEKWRYRKLDDLDLSVVKNRCLQAECDSSTEAFLAGARRRLLLAQELVAAAASRTR